MKFLMAVILAATAAWGQSVSPGNWISSGSYSWSTAGGGAANSENLYCGAGDQPSFGTTDGPAVLPVTCVYTGNLTPPAAIKTICPGGQLQSQWMPHPGTACDYSSIDVALQNTSDGCSVWYMVKATSDGTPTGTQNEYKKNGNQNDIPDTRACTKTTWNWLTTDMYTSLPGAGSRVTPAWVGTTSIAGYPAYAQPPAPGIYLPAIATQNTNSTTLSWCGSAAYWRFMGLELTSDTVASNSSWLVGTLPSASPLCASNFGGDHMIFDRVIVHGRYGTWNTMTSLFTTVWGVKLTGTYEAFINSWCSDFMFAESHCMAWGTGLTSQPIGPLKLYNDFLSAMDEDVFSGGGPQSVTPEDAEIRQNHLFKPLFYDWLCFTPLPSFCQGQYFASGADGTASRTSNVVTFTVSTLYPQSPPFEVGDHIHPDGCSDPSFDGGNDEATFTLTAVTGTAPNFVLTYTQSGTNPDASGVTCALTDHSNTPQVKNALEFKNQDRALVEGNLIEYSWAGQSDQVGEIIALNAIGNAQDTVSAPVSNITLRYNIIRHGNYCIQLGSEQNSNGTVAGIGNNPTATAVGSLGPLSIHDNVCDDINGAYYDISGSGTNSIAIRDDNAYPAPRNPTSVFFNHNTFIQSFVASTHTPGGVGSAGIYNLNDYGEQNFNQGYVNVNGTAVTLSCTFSGTYGTGCDNFATGTTSPNTSPDWANEPIWINNVPYTIASVTDASDLVLTATAGTQTNVPYWAPCTSSQRSCVGVVPPPQSLWLNQTFTNNIGVGGLHAGQACGGSGSAGTIGCYWSSTSGTAFDVQGNIFAINQWTGQTNQSPYPANNQTVTNLAGVGFASYSDGDPTGANDYHVCTGVGTPVTTCAGASPLLSGGNWPTTDNQPPGANIDLIKQYSAGAQ